MRPSLYALALGLGLIGTPAIAADAVGNWLTPGGRGMVAVTDCGGALCGNIVWLKEPNDADGQPLRDHLNKDEDLRGRKIMGLPILLGLTPQGANVWQGAVYDPERGRSFDVTLTFDGANQMSLRGCGLGGLVCKTQIWVRSAQQAQSN
jgi:uncharacterized protein (DUF2147 family)